MGALSSEWIAKRLDAKATDDPVAFPLSGRSETLSRIFVKSDINCLG